MIPTVVVAGSLNMDFVARVPHLPAPGETVLGGGFQMIPGGKGANQACAAGKLGGGHVAARMAGRVGNDVFAGQLKASLSAAGVDVSAVCGTDAQPTGVALIWVDQAGQNSIVVASGANLEFAPDDVESLRPSMAGAAFVLFQLETPLETVRRAMSLAREEGARNILDPAPAQPLAKDILSLADILTPNECEALLLLGEPATRVALSDAPRLTRALRERGAGTVVLKMGDQGCLFDDGERRIHVPAFAVSVIDSTAAGDVFNAGLAVALAEAMPVEQALRFASAAAAISVTRAGAQASIPTRGEVDSFLGS
ncbi:MAG TPA: ribokinase [Bryobacteraceae bacterium]|nr:ribokinase [Bryobacteraceae bacterium]